MNILTNDIPADKFNLYAQFGIAAEYAQTLEVEAGNFLLAYPGLFFKPDQITSEQREMLRSIVDDVNQKTLGRLLKLVKNSATFDHAFLSTFEMALERRNYLMHHFFRTHNFAIHSEDGRKVMIEELKKIQTDVARAHAHLSAATSSLEGITGVGEISVEQVEKLVMVGRKIEI